MLLLSAALLLAMQTTPEYALVEVREGAKGCEYRAEGRRLTQPQLEHRAKVWARQGRKGEVQTDRNISFVCAGQAIFIMQNAGMEKVAYVGKPIGPSVVLAIPAQGCAPIANGETLTMDALRTHAAQWGRDRVELTIMPDQHASYECVDAVLKIIKDSSGIKLGFVGNEAPAR